MKVVQLVAGAGRMYCGACLRENRLAARLIEGGHDVSLVPLYMPIRTDERDVTVSRVFYGGLNVFLQHRFALFRRTHGPLDRILDAPVLLRRIARLTPGPRPRDVGAITLSVLRGPDGPLGRELKKLITWLRDHRPDLITLPNLMFVGVARAIKAELDVPVLCTLAGEDAFLESLPEPYRGRALERIREEVPHIAAFISPTHYYASRVGTLYGVNRDRVHYVPMGIRVDDIGEPATPPREPFTLGFLAAVCEEKGLANLCEAFEIVKSRADRCRLRIAGYVSRTGKRYWRQIRRGMSGRRLTDGIEFLGEVSRAEKIRFLQSLHALSVPTSHPEPKGLYVLEAMACGVPVLQPRHGSFPELIEATGGGLLHEPGNAEALADGILRIKADEGLRRELARAGRKAVLKTFTDTIMAERTWSVYEQYGRGAR